MKKLFVFVLCVLLVLVPFAGCNNASAHTLSVGYAKVDVTPTKPVPLSGFPNPSSRISINVRDPLYATCMAFTDESNNTILVFALEALYCYDVMKMAAGDVAKVTGVPFGNIVICTNHSHSAPNFPSETNPAIEEYVGILREKMKEVAQSALADRKPAKMHITTTYPEKINSIRHYLMSDGSYAGDNFGSFSGGRTVVKPVRDVDNALQLVKFTREGGKDVIMMNWQGHPTGHGEYHYSIMSYSGKVVESVEQRLDCHCMYVLGASGNVNNGSRIPGAQNMGTYENRAAVLAGHVVAAAENYEEVAVGKVQMLRQDVPCTPKEGGGNKVNISLNAFSIGDVAFVTAPYEMFCENGEAVKAGSPFKMTFVSSCSNARGSYIPSISTYDYNNKPDEVYEIGLTVYAPGTGEVLESAFVDMLKQIYETK